MNPLLSDEGNFITPLSDSTERWRKMKICENQYHGARIIEHKTEEVMFIQATSYCEPIIDDSKKFIGYDYPTVQKRGSLVVTLKDGTTEVYPASNWQIEF